MRWTVGPGCCAVWLMLAATQDRPAQDEGNVVIEGQRDQKRLQGGSWEIRLSRAYPFGAMPEDQNERRPMGRDRSWRFCLADADVEPLMRKLVGEGRTVSSGNTSCAPLVVRIGEGRLHATQSCSGSFVNDLDEFTKRTRLVPARSKLTVTGKYTPTSLTIDFDDRRGPFHKDPAYLSPPDGRRWSIQGHRIGDCALDAD